MNAQVSAASGNPDIKLTRGPGYLGMVLPGIAASVPAARHLISTYLDTGRYTDNALTCVTELVTNAILHSASGQPGGRLAVTVEIFLGASVLVSVLDEGARTRQPGPRLADESGRGLAIVEILSDEWGALGTFGTARLTWCRFGVIPPAATPAAETVAEVPAETLRRDGVQRRPPRRPGRGMSETHCRPLGLGIVIGRTKHTETVRCGCGDAFTRPRGETYTTCLKCEIEYRLARTGIDPSDPGLKAIAEHNAMVFAKRDRIAVQLSDRSARVAKVQGVTTR